MKSLTLQLEGKSYNFLYPSSISKEAFIKSVGCVRMGHDHNWSRSWRNAAIAADMPFKYDAKYICFGYGTDVCFIVFPKIIDHDRMYEVLPYICEDYLSYNLLSAGFISNSGHCWGRSETLNIASREETDTKLFRGLNDSK